VKIKVITLKQMHLPFHLALYLHKTNANVKCAKILELTTKIDNHYCGERNVNQETCTVLFHFIFANGLVC
jgi:hypothetical protein